MYKRVIKRLLIGVMAVTGMVTGIWLMNQESGWSDPGMGVPDDEAAALEQAFQSGGWDAFEQAAGAWEGNRSSTSAPAATTQPTVPTTSTKKQNAQTKTPTATATETPKSGKSAKTTYGHDYDKITDEAREAFIYFTADGVANSVYLNIDHKSTENILTGKQLNATRTGKEDGKVSFVSDNKVMSEWKFSNWKSEDDYELDLTSTFTEDKNSEYPDTYNLEFWANKTVSDNNIAYRLNTGMKDTDLHIYKADGDVYEEIYTGKTDQDGYIELNPVELTKYVVSKTDILETQKKTANVAAQSAVVEENQSAETTQSAEIQQEPAQTELNVTESDAIQNTAAAEEIIIETNQEDNNSSNIIRIVIIGAGAAVLVLIIVGVVLVAKNRK